jgi:hypothetical protein
MKAFRIRTEWASLSARHGWRKDAMTAFGFVAPFAGRSQSGGPADGYRL